MQRMDALTCYEQDGECWRWTRATSGGYGALNLEGKRVWAHRVFYEYYVGPIPDDLVIDHLCRNRTCVNPAHMELVTRGENVKRGKQCITECPQGHAYDEINTGRHKITGHRWCRACARERGRRNRRES